MSPRTANPTPLDALFILFASVTLLLLLLWIVTSLSGQALFNQIPPWLQAMVGSVWAKSSVAGGSLGAFLLRRYLDKNPAPNYLLWIPGFMMFLLLALFLAQRLVPSKPLPSQAALRFSVDRKPDSSLEGKQIPDLVFWEQSPLEVPLHGLYPQRTTNPQYPYADVLNMARSQSSTAYIKITEDNSHTSVPGPDYDYKICLDMVPSLPGTGNAPSILLTCAKGVCTPAQDGDPGYMVSCGAHSPNSGLFVPQAFADQTELRQRQAGWVVPSVDTLEKMTDRERVGYTRFDISFTPGSTIQSAHQYYFRLQVNGQPVYINGLLPERVHFPFSAVSTNTLSFALENLNFTG